MPLIKSLFTTLYFRIDHVVNRIENHDAVIEATVKNIPPCFSPGQRSPWYSLQ